MLIDVVTGEEITHQMLPMSDFHSTSRLFDAAAVLIARRHALAALGVPAGGPAPAVAVRPEVPALAPANVPRRR